MKLEVHITDEVIGDILVTAFDGSYGGSWYWAEPFGGSWLKAGDHWTSVHIQEREDDRKVAIVDRERVERGLKLILTGKVGIRQDLLRQVQTVFTDDVDIDADAADCIVQAGVFGELVYG